MIEGSGISPAVPIELDFDALMAGGETQDNQMQKALEVARIIALRHDLLQDGVRTTLTE